MAVAVGAYRREMGEKRAHFRGVYRLRGRSFPAAILRREAYVPASPSLPPPPLLRANVHTDTSISPSPTSTVTTAFYKVRDSFGERKGGREGRGSAHPCARVRSPVLPCCRCMVRRLAFLYLYPPFSLALYCLRYARALRYSGRDRNAFQFLRGAIVGESYPRHVVAVLHSVYEIQTHTELRDVTRIALCSGNYRVEQMDQLVTATSARAAVHARAKIRGEMLPFIIFVDSNMRTFERGKERRKDRSTDNTQCLNRDNIIITTMNED